MSLPHQTTVLIVGAGPAGMAAAISLSKQGIQDITIVDAVLTGENSSRALVIQAATLEVMLTLALVLRIQPVHRLLIPLAASTTS